METYVPSASRRTPHRCMVSGPKCLQSFIEWLCKYTLIKFIILLLNLCSNLYEQCRCHSSFETLIAIIRIAANSNLDETPELPLFYNLEAGMCNNTNDPRRGAIAPKKALALLEEGVANGSISKRDSAFPRVWNNLGNALYQLEQFDEALQLFDQCIDVLEDY